MFEAAGTGAEPSGATFPGPLAESIDTIVPRPLATGSFTDEQQQAVVRRQGSLLLSAGAGSGKTSVLVERFVRAVREDGVAPARVLAITFTERAAGELRERVRARLLELGERDAAREAEEAFIGTFHGFCARLLRTHPLQAGVDPAFEVLDEGLASRLAGLAFGDALRGFLDGERPDSVELAAAYGVDALQRMVLGAYAQLRTQGQSEPHLPPPDAAPPGEPRADEHDVDERDMDERELDGRRAGRRQADELDRQAVVSVRLIDDLLQRFGAAYRARKRARGALDFDDLELCARDLLREHQHIRASWSERFAMLMVDEFQDTNPRQLELLELLDRDNLFTVGDELQSIYGFRHADVRLFRERRERLTERNAALALTHNFRSAPPILAAVERVFKERLAEHFTPLVAARGVGADARHGGYSPAVPHTVEPLAPEPPSGDPLVELLLTDTRGWEDVVPQDAAGFEELPPRAAPWRIAEARLLAARIAALVREGVAQAGEVVVLLRALGDLPLYEGALRAAGLPTLAAAGDFWGHRQVGDLIGYLRALCNPLDELALYGTLAAPLVGISSDGLASIAMVAHEHKAGVWQTLEEASDRLGPLLGVRDRRRIEHFREWFGAERRTVALHPLAQLLRRAISHSRYDAHLRSLPWGERRLANVHKLLRMARSFEAQEGRDLRGFLDHVAHLGAALAGREAEAAVCDAHVDAVRLLSIHASKGLEYPVVCVADLGRAPRLSVPDLFVERDGRIGLRLARLGEPELVATLAYQELREQAQLAQQAEEDRILYVAMTRARDRLILSGALDLARWPSRAAGGPPITWVAPALATDAHDGLRVRCVFNRPGDGQPLCSPSPSPLVPEREPGASVPHAESQPVLHEASAPVLHAASRPVLAPASAELPLSGPDATVSYSSLAELERCGYRYYLERILRLEERRGITEPQGEGRIEARMRGTIVHVLLEGIDFAAPRAPTEADVGRAGRRIGARLSAPERNEIAALLGVALDTDTARRIAQGRHPRREHPFVFALAPGQPLVSGVLDLLVHEPDGSALIVDYKSDRLRPGDDLDALVEHEYGLQRLLYALGALQAGAERVHVVHWFLERPHHPVSASFGAGEREALFARLRTRLEGLRAKGFGVAQVPHRGICLTCPGRGTLCSWEQELTLREQPGAPGGALGSPARVATLSY